MKTLYDTQYFISKFLAIPESRWLVGWYEQGEAACAYGHCGEGRDGCTSESIALMQLFNEYDLSVTMINDGALTYTASEPQRLIIKVGRTPRARILMALKYIQEKECLKRERAERDNSRTDSTDAKC